MVANPPAYLAPAIHPLPRRVVLVIKIDEIAVVSEGMPSGGK
jgi:hypothetical protein